MSLCEVLHEGRHGRAQGPLMMAWQARGRGRERRGKGSRGRSWGAARVAMGRGRAVGEGLNRAAPLSRAVVHEKKQDGGRREEKE
jgi:hypothetical protein